MTKDNPRDNLYKFIGVLALCALTSADFFTELGDSRFINVSVELLKM